MRFLARSLTALFLVAATLGLLGWAGSIVAGALAERAAREGGGPPARERVLAVNVIAAQARVEDPVLTAFGEVRARRVLELRAPVGGRVVSLAEGFEEGGAVEAGQMLLSVDPAGAEADLAVARADLAQAEADARDAARTLELARAEVEAAQAQRDLRAQALGRARDLAERGVGAASAVEAAELSLSAADQAILSRRGAVAQGEARVDAAALSIERARIALGEAERDLADRTLRAAFDGTLSEVSVLEGGLVSLNEKVATLIDPEGLEVAFRLSAAEYAWLLDAEGSLVGAQVTAILDVSGLDVAAVGRIVREAPAVGEGRTGRLIFAALGEAAGIRPGDFVRVEVDEPPLPRAVRLPAAALGPDGTVLVVDAEDRLEAVAVTLLRRQGDAVLVSPEVDGRDVVAERTPALGAGIRVRPLRPEAEADLDAMLSLDPERRARLIAYLEGQDRMPEAVRARLIAELSADEVPAATVARIETRMMGG
jgi:multidrug efflux pump subunit AcrA (membrane-fusion protein)